MYQRTKTLSQPYCRVTEASNVVPDTCWGQHGACRRVTHLPSPSSRGPSLAVPPTVTLVLGGQSHSPPHYHPTSQWCPPLLSPPGSPPFRLHGHPLRSSLFLDRQLVTFPLALPSSLMTPSLVGTSFLAGGQSPLLSHPPRHGRSPCHLWVVSRRHPHPTVTPSPWPAVTLLPPSPLRLWPSPLSRPRCHPPSSGDRHPFAREGPLCAGARRSPVSTALCSGGHAPSRRGPRLAARVTCARRAPVGTALPGGWGRGGRSLRARSHLRPESRFRGRTGSAGSACPPGRPQRRYLPGWASRNAALARKFLWVQPRIENGPEGAAPLLCPACSPRGQSCQLRSWCVYLEPRFGWHLSPQGTTACAEFWVLVRHLQAQTFEKEKPSPEA